MKIKKVLIPAVIVIAAFFIMIALINQREEPPKRKPQIRAKIAQAKVVKLEDIRAEIITYGRLASTEPVVLTSEVAGVIESGTIPFLPAQGFKKGDLLLKIDDRQIIYDLNSTKSDFLNALASVLPELKVDFPKEYEIFQEYFDKCSFDKPLPEMPQVSNQKIKLFLSRFNVYKLYFTVLNLEIRLEKHYFYAPFDGSIITADTRVGSTARSGTRLGEIINMENLELEVPVSAQDVRWLDRAKPIKITSSELDGRWQGKISRVGQFIDERTQTVPVYISIDKSKNSNLFRGVFMKAAIPGKTVEKAVSIPRKALYNKQYVYLINKRSLEYREVEVARKETESIIINGGIANGDTLVTEVLQGVAAGMPATALLATDAGSTQ